jgi:hypothetical protein
MKPSILAGATVLGIFAALVPMPASAATAAPVEVGFVLPLSVPGGRTGIISAVELENYTSPTGLLTRELDSIAGTEITVGIDPMIIASIRLLGSAAPESATEWLDRLAEIDNDTFALSYADSDITIGLQAGATSVVEPTSFDFAIDPSRFTTDVVETPAPGATATPEDPATPALPTSENLLDWNYTLPSVAWPQPATVASIDLDELEAYETTILSSSNVSRASEGVAGAIVGTTDAVVTDDALSSLFMTTIHAQTTEEWQASFDELARAIAATPGRSSAAGASVLIGVDRGSFDVNTRLRATIIAIDGLSTATTVPFGDLASRDLGEATLIDLPQTPERIALVRSLFTAEKADAAFSTVAENPELIAGERRIRLLGAMAPQWNRYPGGWGDDVGNFLEDSTELRNAVRLSKSSDLIFPDRGFLPINVVNDLDQPVTVFIIVKPATPLLAVENSYFELEIEPGSQRRAQIPAVARSNGLVELSVTIRTRSNVQVGTTQYVTTNVQAGWETPLTVGLGVLVLGFFVFGIIRSIRKRRRVAAAEKAADDDEVIIAELEE